VWPVAENILFHHDVASDRTTPNNHMRKRGAQLGHGWRDRLVAARASFDNAVVGPARNTRHFIVHEYRIHKSDNGLELTVRRVLDAGVGRFVPRPKVLIKSAVDTALSFVVGLSANPPFGSPHHSPVVPRTKIQSSQYPFEMQHKCLVIIQPRAACKSHVA
jgi:hypothetical protein